jgi:hypothetical protein
MPTHLWPSTDEPITLRWDAGLGQTNFLLRGSKASPMAQRKWTLKVFVCVLLGLAVNTKLATDHDCLFMSGIRSAWCILILQTHFY